jgi:hypothetical protein
MNGKIQIHGASRYIKKVPSHGATVDTIFRIEKSLSDIRNDKCVDERSDDRFWREKNQN